MAVMDLVLRPATEADRNIAHRLLTAQLIEHRLPADPDCVAHGIDLALAPHSPAWLWLGQREGRPVAIFLANEGVSVERGGLVLGHGPPMVRGRESGSAPLFQPAARRSRRRPGTGG